MLEIIIIFFFTIYLLCEMCKFKKIETVKSREKKRVYNKPVVFVKFLSLAISLILLVIHHFTKNGIVDRSSGIKTTLIYFLVFGLLVLSSVMDLKRVLREDREESGGRIMEKLFAKTVEEAYMKGFEIGVRKAYNKYRDRFSDEEIAGELVRIKDKEESEG
jgi:hypothetical protein